MRTAILLLLFPLLLNSWSSDRDPAVPVTGMTELTCYNVKSKMVSQSDYNIWVATNEAGFNEQFESMACASNINFDEQWVVAILVETAVASYKVTFDRAINRDHSIDVYFHTRKRRSGETVSNPLAMIALPRDPSVKRINFYHGDMMVKSVPIVSVY